MLQVFDLTLHVAHVVLLQSEGSGRQAGWRERSSDKQFQSKDSGKMDKCVYVHTYVCICMCMCVHVCMCLYL